MWHSPVAQIHSMDVRCTIAASEASISALARIRYLLQCNSVDVRCTIRPPVSAATTPKGCRGRVDDAKSLDFANRIDVCRTFVGNHRFTIATHRLYGRNGIDAKSASCEQAPLFADIGASAR